MKIQRVGDPHLGRVFKNNVPLHRRGEREKSLFQQFKSEIQPKSKDVEMVLIMGDLFDKPQVSYETVINAYLILNDAASNHPKVQFWVLQGNHDESRDLTETTAWNLFCLLVCHQPNVRCVCDPVVWPPHVFLPWSPRYTAVQMLEQAMKSDEALLRGEVLTAHGHWDVDLRSPEWNLIPTKELAALGVTVAETGHVHLPDCFERDGITVQVIGSMQALAHGEDGGQGPVRYLTLTSDELFAMEAHELRTSCVRVLLQPGELVPDPVDCLNWQVEMVTPDDGDDFVVEVSMEGFSLAKAYTESMDEASETMLPEVRKKIDDKWNTIFGVPSLNTFSSNLASEGSLESEHS